MAIGVQIVAGACLDGVESLKELWDVLLFDADSLVNHTDSDVAQGKLIDDVGLQIHSALGI